MRLGPDTWNDMFLSSLHITTTTRYDEVNKKTNVEEKEINKVYFLIPSPLSDAKFLKIV